MKTFEEDLKRAVDYHGHLCAGQLVGVRMARLGLKLLAIEDADSYRDLIVFIETDRCLADAIGTVTNCKIGRRRLKVYDFGKMAATFYDLGTGRAYRIYKKYRKHPGPDQDLLEFFDGLDDDKLFDIEEVDIRLEAWDLPGRPLVVKFCSECGEEVLDGRHLDGEFGIICRACDGERYYGRS